ncbi:MAG: hypothetical protein ABSA33_04785, partial [Candidatus Micrarchaeaceae archaeon]
MRKKSQVAVDDREAKPITQSEYVQHQKNKIRLFDILTRVVALREETNFDVTWRFEHALTDSYWDSNKTKKLPGLFLQMPCE